MRGWDVAPPGFYPGGAEVVRRIASPDLGGSHDEIQIEIQIQNLPSLDLANDQEI